MQARTSRDLPVCTNLDMLGGSNLLYIIQRVLGSRAQASNGRTVILTTISGSIMRRSQWLLGRTYVLLRLWIPRPPHRLAWSRHGPSSTIHGISWAANGACLFWHQAHHHRGRTVGDSEHTSPTLLVVDGHYRHIYTANIIPKKRKIYIHTHIYLCYWHVSTCTSRNDISVETKAGNRWNITERRHSGKHICKKGKKPI
jgi:hypothetical protein